MYEVLISSGHIMRVPYCGVVRVHFTPHNSKIAVQELFFDHHK